MEQQRKSRVSIFLKQHEQWSAWCFFTLMSALVLYVTGLRGHELLHTPLLGIMMLYVLKICSLYVRRSSAWAITGIFFACTPLFSAHISELSMSLQFVVLYHVMAWARGKRREFCPRHFFVSGLGTGVAVAAHPVAMAFYIPVVVVMLIVNRRRLLPAVGMLLLGFALIMVADRLIPWPTHPTDTVVPLYFLSLLCVLLPAIATVNRNHPERRKSVHITLGVAIVGIAVAALGGFCSAPQDFFCLLPFALLSLVGTALLLHRRLGSSKGVALLRGLGIICPFITLCLVLIAPVYRIATEVPPPPAQSADE